MSAVPSTTIAPPAANGRRDRRNYRGPPRPEHRAGRPTSRQAFFPVPCAEHRKVREGLDAWRWRLWLAKYGWDREVRSRSAHSRYARPEERRRTGARLSYLLRRGGWPWCAALPQGKLRENGRANLAACVLETVPQYPKAAPPPAGCARSE